MNSNLGESSFNGSHWLENNTEFHHDRVENLNKVPEDSECSQDRDYRFLLEQSVISNTENVLTHLNPQFPSVFTHSSFSENSNSRQDIFNTNQQLENTLYYRRDQVQKLDLSQVNEWNRDLDKSFPEKRNVSYNEDDNIAKIRHSPPPFPLSLFFSTNNDNVTDRYLDNNMRSLSGMPAQNMITPMHIKPLEGTILNQTDTTAANQILAMPVPPISEINETSNLILNPYAFMTASGKNMLGSVAMENCEPGMMVSQEKSSFPPVKEIIQLTKCVLFPPNPYAPCPTKKEKPLVCKTIYVSNLPEKTTEEIIKEVFERCGTIENIKMSMKNFCHVRFTSEDFVENAMYFSGYRLQNKNEPAHSSLIHVDYARSGVDRYEYECKKRALRRQARHQEQEYCKSTIPSGLHFTDHEVLLNSKKIKIEGTLAEALLQMQSEVNADYGNLIQIDYARDKDNQGQARLQEQDYLKSIISPTTLHSTDQEVPLIFEKLKSEETFSQAAHILFTWLNQGECTQRNSGIFYIMIQSVHNHVRKLEVDKVQHEEQLNQTKITFKKKLEGITSQFTELEKIYKAASLQKCWDHFKKAQRKNIDMWKKEIEELKNTLVAELINEREDEEMELSDDEKDNNTKETNIEEVKSQYNSLKEDINCLKCQLDATQNKIMLLKTDQEEELKQKQTQLSVAETALQNCKKEVLNLGEKSSEEKAESKDLCTSVSKIKGEQTEDNSLSDNGDGCGILSTINVHKFGLNLSNSNLIGLISAFLYVHPFGADVEYICSYLHEIDSSIAATDVENLMKQFPTLYKEEICGTGDSLRKKWRFIGLQFSVKAAF